MTCALSSRRLSDFPLVLKWINDLSHTLAIGLTSDRKTPPIAASPSLGALQFWLFLLETLESGTTNGIHRLLICKC